MTTGKVKLKIGIVGCGAIGSRIAESIRYDLKKECRLTALYDINHAKAKRLAQKLGSKKIVKLSLKELIKDCHLMVEAVSAKRTYNIVQQALKAKRSVLAMSVGKLLKHPEIFQLAKKNKCHILLPSGAIAGIDAIKAAGLAKIRKITLTTRKPLSGFRDNAYLTKKGIKISKIKREIILFKGNVNEAVNLFPQNINVAATLALASLSPRKMAVRLMASPTYKKNSHEIEVVGDFGRIYTRTDNVVCPDNPKTSYLAVLSGIQTLKQFCTGILIGT